MLIFWYISLKNNDRGITAKLNHTLFLVSYLLFFVFSTILRICLTVRPIHYQFEFYLLHNTIIGMYYNLFKAFPISENVDCFHSFDFINDNKMNIHILK